MKTLLCGFLTLFCCLATAKAAENDLNSAEQLAQRCPLEKPTDPALKGTDFKWSYSLPELIQKFTEIYDSPKRLPHRAYWDSSTSQLMLPFDPERGGPVPVPPVYVRSVQRHLEEAFRLQYIDGVFFPDLGHSHFLIPQRNWDQNYAKVPVGQLGRLFALLFTDPDVKTLYHTAEQLRTRDDNGELIPDRRTQWRFYSRNLVGDNRGEGRLELLQDPTSRANTVGEVAGYRWWGAGFNISANREGCLAARRDGKVFYFDLSLDDLEF